MKDHFTVKDEQNKPHPHTGGRIVSDAHHLKIAFVIHLLSIDSSINKLIASALKQPITNYQLEKDLWMHLVLQSHLTTSVYYINAINVFMPVCLCLCLCSV